MWRNAYLILGLLLTTFLFAETNKPLHGGDDVELHLFFAMDNNWYQEDETEKLSKWMDQKLIDVENGVAKYNLNGDCGAGPNCAQWNPETDLLLICKAPPIFAPNATATISFNDQDTSYKMLKVTNEDLSTVQYYYWIKREFFHANLRKITEADYPELHGENWKEREAAGDQFVAPLNTGEVIDIHVNLLGRKAHMMFHASFGE